MKKSKLSLFLIKKDIAKEKIFANDTKILKLTNKYELHYKPTTEKTPKWVDTFFNDEIESSKLFRTRSVSAAMCLERTIKDERRNFVVTFGFGRYLLNDDVIEERFGLLTALNSIDENKMRSVDISTLESVLLNNRMQVSSLSEINDFNINENKDVLKAVTGRIEEKDISETISGRDSLIFSTGKTYKTIGPAIDRYYSIYKSDKYKKNFGWVDNILPIRSEEIINKLNQVTVQKLNSGDLDKIGISFPEILDWNDMEYFSIGSQGHVDDVDIQIVQKGLLDTVKDKITLEKLHNEKIYAYNAFNQRVKSWSVYKCLYVDLREANTQYYLYDGRWYSINSDFVREINTFYSKVKVSDLKFDNYDVQREDDYNERIAITYKDTYRLMDKKLKQIGGSKIEICDLLSKNHEFIHVKKYTGSAVLSHLFNQGLVAAECLKSDGNFRDQVNKSLDTDFLIPSSKDNFELNKYEVVFVIAQKNYKRKPDIPFFSKVSLRNVGTTLSLLGFKYSIIGIPYTWKNPGGGK